MRTRTSLTPEEVSRLDTSNIIRKVLKSDYRLFQVSTFSMKEGYDNKKEACTHTCLTGTLGSQRFEIESSGVGVVDSVFKGFQETFQESYKSLGLIKIHSFQIETSPLSTIVESTEDQVTAFIEFKNSYGKIVPFRFSSLSLAKSAVFCLALAFEHYVNSESSFRKLKALIREADSRGRSDIKDNYINDLISIVGVSSYEEVL